MAEFDARVFVAETIATFVEETSSTSEGGNPEQPEKQGPAHGRKRAWRRLATSALIASVEPALDASRVARRHHGAFVHTVIHELEDLRRDQKSAGRAPVSPGASEAVRARALEHVCWLLALYHEDKVRTPMEWLQRDPVLAKKILVIGARAGRMGTRESTEDVRQETMLNVLDREILIQASELYAYVSTAARNVANSERKGQSRFVLGGEVPDTGRHGAQDVLDGRQLMWLFEKWKSEQKGIYLLGARMIEHEMGITQDIDPDVAKLSKDSKRAYHHRARMRLRAFLVDAGYDRLVKPLSVLVEAVGAARASQPTSPKGPPPASGESAPEQTSANDDGNADDDKGKKP